MYTMYTLYVYLQHRAHHNYIVVLQLYTLFNAHASDTHTHMRANIDTCAMRAHDPHEGHPVVVTKWNTACACDRIERECASACLMKSRYHSSLDGLQHYNRSE